MKRNTKVNPGVLVSVKKDLSGDPKYQVNLWKDDTRYFLRDPETLRVIDVAWVVPGEPCIVVDQDLIGVVILTPRGHSGWIEKEKVEIVK